MARQGNGNGNVYNANPPAGVGGGNSGARRGGGRLRSFGNRGGNGGSGGSSSGGNNGGGGRSGGRQHNYDSNGPIGRVRGNASQVYERYVALARDAGMGNDHVLAESLQQHAEHYYRIMLADGYNPNAVREPKPVAEDVATENHEGLTGNSNQQTAASNAEGDAHTAAADDEDEPDLAEVLPSFLAPRRTPPTAAELTADLEKLEEAEARWDEAAS
jgi:hypothetical protein